MVLFTLPRCVCVWVDTEAGIVLDLLESLARHLTSLDVSSQRRLMETKYKLLSTTVSSRHMKQVSELAFQALETGTYWHKTKQIPP